MVHTHFLIAILLGLTLLFFGRDFFWFFVGGVGFVSGMELGLSLFPTQPHAFVVLVALTLGIIGVALAFTLQKFAIGLAGFGAGGHLVSFIFQHSNFIPAPSTSVIAWIIIMAGGVVGAYLMLRAFDWALIALSSITGAILLSYAELAPQAYTLLVLVLMAFLGITVQSRRFLRDKLPA